MEMNTLARKVVWSVGTQASRAKTNETIEEQTQVAYASELGLDGRAGAHGKGQFYGGFTWQQNPMNLMQR